MRYLIIAYCLLFNVLYSSAQSANGSRDLAAISSQLSAIKTLQCDFVQTKHVRMLNEDMVSKGKMCYQQADKLRWEFISPYTYAFILNGDKVKVESGNRRDVIDINRNKVFKEIARIMMNSVVGNSLSDDKNFKYEIRVSGQWTMIELTPLRKDMKQMFQKIVLHYNSQQKNITKVVLTEKNGDLTTIELKNIRKNEKIAANMFAIN